MSDLILIPAAKLDHITEIVSIRKLTVWMDLKSISRFERVSKFFHKEILDGKNHVWEAAYQILVKELRYPRFWNPIQDYEWKLRFKARIVISKGKICTGTADYCSKQVDERLVSVMNGRILPVCSIENEHLNEPFVNQISRGLLDTEFLNYYITAEQYNREFDLPATQFRDHLWGFRFRQNIFKYPKNLIAIVWWTADGKICLDNLPIEWEPGFYDMNMTADLLKTDFALEGNIFDGSHIINLRIFWDMSFVYGYYGCVGCDYYDCEIRDYRQIVLDNGHFKELFCCSSCKARNLCSNKCQKKDWKSHVCRLVKMKI